MPQFVGGQKGSYKPLMWSERPKVAEVWSVRLRRKKPELCPFQFVVAGVWRGSYGQWLPDAMDVIAAEEEKPTS